MRSVRLSALALLLTCSSLSHAQYYEYDPDDPTNVAPIRKGEKALIPLDTGDPTYNLWQTPRDDLTKGQGDNLISGSRQAPESRQRGSLSGRSEKPG